MSTSLDKFINAFPGSNMKIEHVSTVSSFSWDLDYFIVKDRYTGDILLGPRGKKECLDFKRRGGK